MSEDSKGDLEKRLIRLPEIAMPPASELTKMVPDSPTLAELFETLTPAEKARFEGAEDQPVKFHLTSSEDTSDYVPPRPSKPSPK